VQHILLHPDRFLGINKGEILKTKIKKISTLAIISLAVGAFTASPSSAAGAISAPAITQIYSGDASLVVTFDAAEASGALKPGGTIVEATSGNTGILMRLKHLVR